MKALTTPKCKPVAETRSTPFVKDNLTTIYLKHMLVIIIVAYTVAYKRGRMAPPPGYNVRKAAQVIAFFAIKEGGDINVLKLAKLVYLADRKFMEKYDSPILYDLLVSMPHGPANSITLNYVNGLIQDPDNWDRFVSDRSKHNVGLSNPELLLTGLAELSKAEIAVMSEVWDNFGHMTQYQLRDYTHAHCPEWEDPQGSSNSIPYERVLKYLGKNPEIADAINEDRLLADALG